MRRRQSSFRCNACYQAKLQQWRCALLVCECCVSVSSACFWSAPVWVSGLQVSWCCRLFHPARTRVCVSVVARGDAVMYTESSVEVSFFNFTPFLSHCLPVTVYVCIYVRVYHIRFCPRVSLATRLLFSSVSLQMSHMHKIECGVFRASQV